MIFASAAVRRHAQDHGDAFVFPFTTRTVGAGRHANPGTREDALPFAYAALKPLFAPEGVGPAEVNEKKRIDPLPLVRLIRAGRVGHAIRHAQIVAQGAGLNALIPT